MIAVIFEVVAAPSRKQQYLDLAVALKKELGEIDGFISVERFQSLSDPGKMLSLSFFRDEAAVLQWRNTAAHRATQRCGRSGVFSDYRLRVAYVARDYGMFDRDEAPADSRIIHAEHPRPGGDENGRSGSQHTNAVAGLCTRIREWARIRYALFAAKKLFEAGRSVE